MRSTPKRSRLSICRLAAPGRAGEIEAGDPSSSAADCWRRRLTSSSRRSDERWLRLAMLLPGRNVAWRRRAERLSLSGFGNADDEAAHLMVLGPQCITVRRQNARITKIMRHLPKLAEAFHRVGRGIGREIALRP
jgi:hypothetical protein